MAAGSGRATRAGRAAAARVRVARRFGAAARFGRGRFLAAARFFLGRATRRFAFGFFVFLAFFAVERRVAFFRGFAITCLLSVRGTKLAWARASTVAGGGAHDVDRPARPHLLPSDAHARYARGGQR
jgi:hypothetical protein